MLAAIVGNEQAA